MKINLFINQYEDADAGRQEELNHVLRLNRSNKLLTNIYPVNSRKYRDLFQYCDLTYGTENDINIIANSDIFFDDTLIEFYTNSALKKFMKEHGFLALCRWNWVEDKYCVHNVNYSQDTWIWYGKPKTGMMDMRTDYNLGIWSVDNKMAWAISSAGYNIKCYPWLIKTYHHHPSEIRRTGPQDALPEPLKLVEPENFPLQVPETAV